jgi:Fe-S oxidoreductase
MPEIPSLAERARLPELTPAQGERRGRVAFFTGCLMSEVFAPVQQASVRVLAANGFEVVVPREQGCCGALLAHAGDLEHARELARHNTRVFGGESYGPVDAIILDSAGCGAAMREANRWIPGEGDAMASRVRDVCEFLDEVGLRAPPGRYEARVCYDDPCHLVHGQGVEAAPRRLLGKIDGIELVAHVDPSRCCGAAGTYNLTHPEMSAAILCEKMDALLAVDPHVIATGNPGCLMQIAKGVRQRGSDARVVHPVEILDAAYRSRPV